MVGSGILMCTGIFVETITGFLKAKNLRAKKRARGLLSWYIDSRFWWIFFLLLNDHYNRIVGGVCHKSVIYKKAGRKIRVK